MGISYEDALRAQAEIEDKLLEDPNVVSVDVVEETDDLGRSTGNYVVQVGIISTESYRNALKHNQSLIPAEHILYSKDGTKEKHIRIDVVKEGRIQALSKRDLSDEKDLPSVGDVLASAQVVGDHASRRRPSPCGYSIGHPSISAGTMGLLLEYQEGPNLGKAYILSNNHVLAACDTAFVGDPITQPGRDDLGVVGKDTIATLHRWVPLQKTGINQVDAAIAEVSGGKGWSKHVAPYVSKIGQFNELVDAKVGMSVEKTGRSTGYTQGRVESTSATIKVDYGQSGVFLFKKQIRTTNMSKGGDSGSCLVESVSKKPIGLLFAGGAKTYYNHIGRVLSSLHQPHTIRYPSGKTHTFSADHPLRILRRGYSTTASAFLPMRSAQPGFKAPTRFSLPLTGCALGLASFGIYQTRSNRARLRLDQSQSYTSVAAPEPLR